MSLDQKSVIELLAHQELSKFQRFIRDHWKEDHLFAKESSVFDWQHKGPHAYHYMVAKQGESLVGIQGIIPQSQFDSDLPNNQIFLSAWKVIEDRGLGLGFQIYQAILKEYAPEFIGGIGMNPRLISFHKWQGFTVATMEHHVALSPFVDGFHIARVPDDLMVQPRKKKSSVSFKKLTETDLKYLDTEALYLHQWPLKSNRYIQNHYMNHPMYTYDVYAISKDKKTKGLCVIRPILKDGSVVLRFVDFIGPNENFPLLHDFVLDLLETSHAEYLDLYSHGVPSVLLEEAGFINRMAIKNLIIPNYFEPFERRNVDLLCDHKSLRKTPPVRFFKGDSDMDRPNQLPEDPVCLNN